MSAQEDSCILFFVKYPDVGQVKTRLSSELGNEAVVSLYKDFILDMLSTIEKLGLPIEIFYRPDSAKEKLASWLGQQYSYVPQRGEDLGERMRNASLHAFNKNFSRVVIIGSDIPDLPADFLREAFLSLESRDAVIGPAGDGGYYLIGFTRTSFLPEVFENISWSSDSVFNQTVSILKQYKRKVYLLPQWHDVDTSADLKSLLLRNRNTDFEQSRTFSFLKRHATERI